jgi:hypothetical protein
MRDNTYGLTGSPSRQVHSMTTNRKTIHKSDVRLKPIDWLSESVRRRARSKLLAADEESAKQNQALARQLMALRSEYRRNLAALIGAGGCVAIESCARSSRRRRGRNGFANPEDCSKRSDSIACERSGCASSIATQNVLDTQESRIFNFIDTDWGDGTSWSNFVSAPRDIHWYYFKTAESFAQGSALVLEAGVWNSTWYFADDESITTADDLDLRLDRIMVRSCPS